MPRKKSKLKKIKATVMPQTEKGLKILMESTGLTMGEVIDRLTLQMYPEQMEHAVQLAAELVFFSISKVPKEQFEDALMNIIILLAEFVPADHLKGLEQTVIANCEETHK